MSNKHMAEFPALPLWTDAYLADTLDLSDSEHGLYLIMLMIAWRRPDCALPDDMGWLKRALQACCRDLHGRTFNALVPRLLERFWSRKESETGPKWVQKRLEIERKYLRNKSDIQRKHALKRWNNNGIANADAMPSGNAPTPTPTPIIERTPLKRPPKGGTDTPEFLAFWETYPTRVGKGAARRAFATALAKTDLATILAGVERYKRTKPPTVDWCHPATFLNGERWLDEPAKQNGVANGNGRVSKNGNAEWWNVPKPASPDSPPPRVVR